MFGKAFAEGWFNYPSPKKIPGCRQKETPFFLVGDEIFPLKDWLMRPYPGMKRGTLDESRSIFNYRLSRARRVIENSFGVLAARWRIFRRFIRASAENVEKYILATLALHNYLLQTDNAGYCPSGFVDSEDSTGRITPGEWRSDVASGDASAHLEKPHNVRHTKDAIAMRDALKEWTWSSILATKACSSHW